MIGLLILSKDVHSTIDDMSVQVALVWLVVMGQPPQFDARRKQDGQGQLDSRLMVVVLTISRGC